MISEISKYLNIPFIEWHGFETLMLGGWRQLPLKFEDAVFKDKSENNIDMVKELIVGAIPSSYKLDGIEAWSINGGGYLTVKVKGKA